MLNDINQDARERMEKAIIALQGNLAKIRTGRAHPSILDQVMVDYYGSMTPINQVANVAVEDSRTLSVTPWEASMVGPVEKAIMNSDVGITPTTVGSNIRLPMPPMTEERRKDMTKIAKADAEQARVSVRNIRRDANDHIKALLKDKEISEDDAKRGENDIQKITDEFVAKVDELVAVKEKDLLEI